MRTLVFTFDVSKLDEPMFQEFFTKLFRAQDGVPLGLCKFSTFDTHGTLDVVHKLDELRDADGNEVPNVGVRCLCPMCEHHRTAEEHFDSKGRKL